MSNNVILQLPELSWRGLTARYSEISYEFAHEQSPRHYPFRNVQGHQHTGRLSSPVSAVLHFLNTDEPDSYPGQWVQWREALFDGTPGELDHPDLGTIDAVVQSGSVTITSTVDAGLLGVRVNWIETNLDVDADAEFTTPDVDVVTAAEQLDDTMADLGISYPDGMFEQSLFEAVSSVQGQVFSAGLSVSGKMTQIQGNIQSIVEGHERAMAAVQGADAAVKDAIAGKPAVWLLYAQADMLREALETQKAIARQKGRPTSSIKADRPISLANLVDVTGSDISDLIELNPHLLGPPVVPAGAQVEFYT